MSGEPTVRPDEIGQAKEDLLRRAAETCVQHAHGARPEIGDVLTPT